MQTGGTGPADHGDIYSTLARWTRTGDDAPKNDEHLAGPHMFPELPFAPTLHVFCAEAVIAIDDDVPKYADLPEATGGSGALLSEAHSS
jgi:hypothetical protein